MSLVTVNEAARVLGRGSEAIRRIIERRGLDVHYTPTGGVRISLEDVRAAYDRHGNARVK